MSGMQLNMNVSQRMEQTMRLAPRMIQSMEILQLPIMALEERIRQIAITFADLFLVRCRIGRRLRRQHPQ